jgi:hypothetical protein
MALNENDVPDRTKFGLLNLDSGSNPSANNPGASTLGGWLQGYADALPVNTYYTVAEGNKNGLKNDIDNVLHRTLLFPVFDPDRSNPDFYVIGWAAFVIDARGAWDGHSHVLTGHFVTFKREDLQFDGGTPGGTYFGVPLVITLIK